MATTTEASATQQTYDRAIELVAGGLSRKAAFERIAAETGVSAGTVQARYYRIANKVGTVEKRTGSKQAATRSSTRARRRATAQRSGRAPAPAATNGASIADQLDAAAKLMQQAAAEVRRMEADASKLRAVRGLIG